MNEARIEAALEALGKQTPKLPEKSLSDMVKTVRLLSKERSKRTGKPVEQARRRELTTGKPEKTHNKTL